MRIALVTLLGAWLLWLTLGSTSLAAPQAPTAPPAAPSNPDAMPARADLGAAMTPAAAPDALDATAHSAREAVPDAGGDRSATTHQLKGHVLLPSGEGTCANVRAGKLTLQTDDDGSFAIEVGDGDDLLAWRAEYEPVRIGNVARFANGDPLDVVLPGKACTIDGVLVTADGAPCKGWRIDLCGGALDCGDVGLPKLSIEDFVAGGRSFGDRSVFVGRMVVDDGRDGVVRVNPNERLIGDDGAFCVGGLRRGQTYTLRAWNEETLQTVRSSPIVAPTSGYRFVVPSGEWRERVRGRVIDRRGAPLGGVQVRLTMRVHVNGGSESYQTGQTVITRVDGAFAFTRVPCVDLLLRFNGAEVESLYREFPANEPADDLVVPLGCQGSFRLEPTAGAVAPASLRVLDQGGKALRLSRQIGEGRSEGGERLWLPGKAPGAPIQVSDEAAWLVLEDENGRELRRTPLLVTRGEERLVH